MALDYSPCWAWCFLSFFLFFLSILILLFLLSLCTFLCMYLFLLKPNQTSLQLYRKRRDDEEVIASREATCGICLNPIATRFGLLTGCNHSFCLQCIRNWRQAGLEYQESDVVRSCPLCRILVCLCRVTSLSLLLPFFLFYSLSFSHCIYTCMHLIAVAYIVVFCHPKWSPNCGQREEAAYDRFIQKCHEEDSMQILYGRERVSFWYSFVLFIHLSVFLFIHINIV